MFKELIANPWVSSVVVFITQIIIFYLRTMNIIYTVDRKILAAVLSSSGVNLLGLISMAVGVSSLMAGEWQSIVTLLIGGSIGTYLGMKTESKHKNKKIDHSTFFIDGSKF